MQTEHLKHKISKTLKFIKQVMRLPQALEPISIGRPAQSHFYKWDGSN